MRKFSSKRLYSLIRNIVLVIALLGVGIGVVLTYNARSEATFYERVQECENNKVTRTSGRLGRIEVNCSDTADIQIQTQKENAFAVLALGVFPLGVFYAIRGIFVYLFPKHKEKESD